MYAESRTGKSENIAGYYAWFKLLTGFRKELFMTTAEVENHARKYSTAYRYDLENNKKGSKWTTDFEAMALKTVIKMLLSKWGNFVSEYAESNPGRSEGLRRGRRRKLRRQPAGYRRGTGPVQ